MTKAVQVTCSKNKTLQSVCQLTSGLLWIETFSFCWFFFFTIPKCNNIRITLANRSYFGLVNMLKPKNVNRKYKVIIYKTLIKPVLMYGVETWVLSKAYELRLGVLERKILRSIYGPICEGAIWRSRYNEELYRLYDETDLVTTIRITRLRWAGHIVWMQDNLPCKKITLDKPEGRRRVGRPNLRWMDGVMRDAERLGIRNWRIKAKERDGWRRLLESAKTLHGL